MSYHVESANSLEVIQREMNNVLRENLSVYHKMIVLDMDETILKKRFINECADSFWIYASIGRIAFQ